MILESKDSEVKREKVVQQALMGLLAALALQEDKVYKESKGYRVRLVPEVKMALRAKRAKAVFKVKMVPLVLLVRLV